MDLGFILINVKEKSVFDVESIGIILYDEFSGFTVPHEENISIGRDKGWVNVRRVGVRIGGCAYI